MLLSTNLMCDQKCLDKEEKNSNYLAKGLTPMPPIDLPFYKSWQQTNFKTKPISHTTKTHNEPTTKKNQQNTTWKVGGEYYSRQRPNCLLHMLLST
jgi:hypothetical protein